MVIDECYQIVTIKVFISSLFNNEKVLLDIISGVEEESIPLEVEIKEIDDGMLLAYEAALQSNLQVGIGIDSKGIVAVHYTSLDKETPLFKVDYNIESKKIRAIGSNSARLVKGIPFIL